MISCRAILIILTRWLFDCRERLSAVGVSIGFFFFFRARHQAVDSTVAAAASAFNSRFVVAARSVGWFIFSDLEHAID